MAKMNEWMKQADFFMRTMHTFFTELAPRPLHSVSSDVCVLSYVVPLFLITGIYKGQRSKVKLIIYRKIIESTVMKGQQCQNL